MREMPSGLLSTFVGLLLLGACQRDPSAPEPALEEHILRGDEHLQQNALSEAIFEYRSAVQIDRDDARGHYGLAQAYLRSDRIQNGLEELRASVRLDPADLDAQIQLAEAGIAAGAFEESLEHADAVIAADPARTGAYLLRGLALESLDRAPEAARAYEQALRVDPQGEEALRAVAIHRWKRGDREGAELLYRKIVEVSPTTLSYGELGEFLAEDPARYDEAAAAFRHALAAAGPEDRARRISRLASLYFERDRLDEAVRVLERGIASEPDPLDLVYLLARVELARGRRHSADELVRLAAESRPRDVRAHLVRSAYLGRQGDLQGALAAAKEAIEVDPRSDVAKLRMAEVLTEMSHRDRDPHALTRGRAIVDEILARDPAQPRALFVQAKMSLAAREFRDAARALVAVVAAEPEWGEGRYVLGTALALLGQKVAARAELVRALQLDAGLVEARKILAKVHFDLGEPDGAARQGRLYLRERPRDGEVRVLVAESLLILRQPEAALHELEAVPERARDASVQSALARTQLALGRSAEARAALLRAYEESPDSPSILRMLTLIDLDAGRTDESNARIEAALAKSPEDPRLHQLRGLSYLRQDRPEGEQSLRRAIALDPDDLESPEYLARYLARVGRSAEAIPVLEEALAHGPGEARLHHFLAVLLELEGRPERAIERYEAAIRQDANLAESKNNLAHLYANAGRSLDRALALARDARARLPDDPSTADTLGWVLHQRGDSAAAIEHIRQAEAELLPTDSSIDLVRYHLALAYEKTGDRDRARAAAQRSLAGLQQLADRRRARGASATVEPDWAADARAVLARLTDPEPGPAGGDPDDVSPR